ncbi:alpha/beta hydrolase family protein [Glycomyces dulcitolivorans]|uniref:alpha/beta hydrolase family protein n=1 Tax=Glycomyces dulcitolivorans TaxID=2200759 RepID=UPI0013003E72|nr:alpha/beta fold hydrolase [Glycomyces dulcitolivorans]
MQRSTRRTLIGATAALAAAGIGAAGITAASAEEPAPAASYSLPEPTGEYGVGTEVLYLVDEDRADPWFPDEDRQLMATMWFPTEDQGETAPYMTAEESAVFVDQLRIDAPADYFSTVETNSVADAEPVRGKLPLILLSPGWSFPRATLTSFAEDLASHGYAVAAVGHNYEAPTSLPDGETNPCLACPSAPDGLAVTENRAADLSFVLDELTARGSEWRRHLDRDDVIAGGHSMGGSAAHAVMQTDDRFAAGFNLDGKIHDVDDATIDDPFLLVGNERNGLPGAAANNWPAAWDQMTGWKRWIQVEQTTHSTFTDLTLFAADLDIPMQEMDGAYAVALTRAYVLAFADQELRGADEPLLDGPSAEWPEAVFHNP